MFRWSLVSQLSTMGMILIDIMTNVWTTEKSRHTFVGNWLY